VRDCPFGEIEALHHTSPIRPWISFEGRMSLSENRLPLFRDMRLENACPWDMRRYR
jgi:hypothetical protein